MTVTVLALAPRVVRHEIFVLLPKEPSQAKPIDFSVNVVAYLHINKVLNFTNVSMASICTFGH
jgi:hypothetical protein